MLDDTGKGKKRKRVYFSSALIGLVSLVGVVAFTVLHPAPQTEPVIPSPVSRKNVPAEATPITGPAILGRSELLAVARSAASTFAAEGKIRAHNSVLQRRFSVRIAFGCFEDGNTGGQTSLTFNPDNQSAVLSAKPGNWIDAFLIKALPWKEDIEAVEGFWVPRAWTDAESCPPQTDYVQPVSPTLPTAQSVGLAQIFPVGGARQARHSEKPYLFTRKLPSDDPDLRAHHYYLLLEGRITGFPDGRDLQCWMEGADHRPLCVFAVEFENVAFEDGITGKVLASWRS